MPNFIKSLSFPTLTILDNLQTYQPWFHWLIRLTYTRPAASIGYCQLANLNGEIPNPVDSYTSNSQSTDLNYQIGFDNRSRSTGFVQFIRVKSWLFWSTLTGFGFQSHFWYRYTRPRYGECGIDDLQLNFDIAKPSLFPLSFSLAYFPYSSTSFNIGLFPPQSL